MNSSEKFLNSLINYERTISPYYDFKLDKFRRCLKTIGNPEKKLSNVILIAGTKGKGSTATFIESALRASGLKTGLFTSPHIISLRERIKVNGKQILEKDLDRLINKIKPHAKKSKITFFEAITAVAFLYFIEKKVDYTILEVGLGGRLDATNVTKPKVSVITKIGYDHIEILGKTLTKIAKEKAGVIHRGSYVIYSLQKPSALKVIKDKIKATKSKYYDTSKEMSVKDIKTSMTGSEFTVYSRNGLIGEPRSCVRGRDEFRINLLGKHQIENSVTALAVLNYLKEKDSRITNNGIKKGFMNAKISARCQIVSKDPLIIVDGAHNPDSAKSLYDVIKNLIKQKVIIVFGSSRGKLVKEMFKILAPVTRQFILTQSENPRHIPVTELGSILKDFFPSYQAIPSINDAIKQGINISSGKIPLVITGSFYVASESLVILKKSK